MITTSAPGMIILFGEHAVVYGEAAIATAVNKRVKVTACGLDEPKIVVESKNLGETYDAKIRGPTKEPVVKAVQESLKKLGKGVGIGISIDSEIPVGVGMGSSASVSTAASAAVLNLLSKEEVEPVVVATVAYEAEKVAQTMVDFIKILGAR